MIFGIMDIENMVMDMGINYDKMQKTINEYGKYILSCIKSEFGVSLTSQQMQTLEYLLNTEFIIIESPSNADIEFFSKQEGIENPDKYSIDYVPSAHGGRTKSDNKIHIYPYAKAFSDCKTDDEIIKLCVDSIVVHEIFHYFIRPNLSLESDTIKNEFGHFLTEGLVQYYTEVFMEKHGLGRPKSNYGKNVEFAKNLISFFPPDLSQTQIDRIVFTYSLDELLKISQKGKELYQKYCDDLQFQKDLSAFIIDLCLNVGMNEEQINGIIKHYMKMTDLDTMLDELSKHIEMTFKDNTNMKDSYLLKLRSLIPDKSKDLKTVIDMLCQDYPFDLDADLKYDEFIGANFPLQFEFSKRFREFIKEVMTNDYKLENPTMSLEDEMNYKLKYIKSVADGFLLMHKDESGRISWSIDDEKIQAFMNPSDTRREV